MTECNHEAFSVSSCRKRQVKGSFAGGSISSNGGAFRQRVSTAGEREPCGLRCERRHCTMPGGTVMKLHMFL